MRILHTSDLHLGKNLFEESFYEDQKYILNEIVDIIKRENVKALMIAGDVYDKSIPSVEAVNLFNDFLNKLLNLNINVLIISGNHDSNDRLGYGSDIFKHLNINIVSNYNGYVNKIDIEDVSFYLIPFVRPFHLKKYLDLEEYSKINNSNDMIKYILKDIKLDKNRKNILMLHQFVTYNGYVSTTDSESIKLGTLDSIDANLIENFDYVALGHVHRAQKIKNENIRYSGTPLAYSFSEANDKKSVVLIDTDINDFKLIELNPKRKLKVLKGTFDEIMNLKSSEDIIRVELLDECNIISPMDEIKKRFPNAISLSFINKEVKEIKELKKISDPFSLFNVFFEEQNERELTKEEIDYIKELEKCD